MSRTFVRLINGDEHKFVVSICYSPRGDQCLTSYFVNGVREDTEIEDGLVSYAFRIKCDILIKQGYTELGASDARAEAPEQERGRSRRGLSKH